MPVRELMMNGYFPNFATNISSDRIGIFSSCAFLFFPLVLSRSLLTRYVVLEETDPETLPPRASTEALNSSLVFVDVDISGNHECQSL